MLQPLWVFPRQVNSYTFHSRLSASRSRHWRKIRAASFHPEHEKSTAHPCRKSTLKAHWACHELNPARWEPASRFWQPWTWTAPHRCQRYDLPLLLVPYLKQFHKKFPNVPIKVTNATSVSCVDLLEQGKVDLIVTNFPNAHLNHSYIRKTVCNFTDVFIANPAYFNLKQQEIPFEELKQYPILMLDRKSTTSEFLHNLFLQHQLELIPEVELSSNDLLIDLARIGLGIAFIPDYCLSRESKDLYVVRTKEKLPSRQMVASINPTLPVSQSTEEFLKLLPEL